MAREDEADELYGLPLEEFTAARNRLARDLKKRGEGGAAERVAKLQKPTQPAWVVNQLARRRARDVERLLDAGEALRDAHERMLSGGSADALRKAADRERKAVDKLVGEAKGLSGGMREPLLERVRKTLHAAASDDALRGEIEQGRVVKDREPSGLGPLMAGGSRTPKRSGRARSRNGSKERERDQRRMREARDRERDARGRLRDAEKTLERTRRELARLERDRRKAEQAVARARDDLDAATESVRSLRASR